MEGKSISVLCVFLTVLTTAQCEFLAPRYSTKTGYDLAFDENNILKRELSWQELAKEFSPELETCKPIGLYVVYRHGSRYPSGKDIMKFNGFLERTRNEPINPDFQYVRNEKNMSSNLNHMLSASGKMEMNQLAGRLKRRFPELIQDQFDLDLSSYAFQSTNLSRTIDSTVSYIQGLIADNYNCSGVLNEDELSVSCKEPHSSSSPSKETVVVPVHNKTSDYLLRFFDTYEDCLQEQVDADELEEDDLESNDVMREDDTFLEGQEVADMQQRLSQRLSVPEDSEGFTISRDEAIYVAKMCAYGLALFNQSSWCDLLSDEDLSVFEYKQDLKHYWKRGYGHPVNYLVGCNLARDIVSYFEQMTSGQSETPKGVFKFSHAETIIPLECLLDLYKDKHPLTAASYQEHKSRLFRTSWMTPFAANVAVVIFNCSSEADNAKDLAKYRVQVLVNEIPVNLPFCQRSTCELAEFANHVRDVSGTCNFNNTCCIENCGCKQFKFNQWTIYCIVIAVIAYVAWMLILTIESRHCRAKYTLIKNN